MDEQDMRVDGAGVIVAVPNRLHLEVGRFFAERGVHLHVEKPIADGVTAGKQLRRGGDSRALDLCSSI